MTLLVESANVDGSRGDHAMAECTFAFDFSYN